MRSPEAAGRADLEKSYRELVKRGIHYRHYVTEHEGHATRLAVEDLREDG